MRVVEHPRVHCTPAGEVSTDESPFLFHVFYILIATPTWEGNDEMPGKCVLLAVGK